MTKKPAYRKLEDQIRRGLILKYPDAPGDVVDAEARHRLRHRALAMRESGATLAATAKAIGYSVGFVNNAMLPAARQQRAEGTVAPLTTWLAHRPPVEPAPAPEEAIEPMPEAKQPATPAQERSYDDIRLSLVKAHLAKAEYENERRSSSPNVWHLIQDGNGLTLVEPPVPAPTPAPDPALLARIEERGPMLTSAVRLLQLAAGIPATGTVDDETMSVVAGLAAWQSRPRPLMDAVERFVDGRRASDRLTEGVIAA